MTHRRRRTAAVLATAVSAAAFIASAHAQTTVVGRRAVGIDVSDWQEQNAQGHINWATVAAPASSGGGGKNFAFIRSSRGGTTGTYDEHAGTGTLSMRYDDYEWVYNVTNATANGILVGPYHFGRPDILTNTGADEANHMIEQAGNWMRPGYMLPTFDFEAGATQRDTPSLSQFAVDFANRIKQVKGISPLVYINQSYAISEIDSTVPAAMPNNWVARWPNQIYYEAVEHQNGNPVPSPVTANVYGQWNTSFPVVPQPEPWKFWQYSSRGRVPGIGNNAVEVDLDVAHGDLEYVKDFLVPALWMTDTNGDWSTLSQWNSDNPGYIAGNDSTGPAPRLPNQIDTVILDRGAANPTITLSSGSHTVRKLVVRENLSITGGSLNVGFVPTTPLGGNHSSGTTSVQFSNNATISGGALSAHTIQVDAAKTLNLNGGTLTFNTLNLVPDAATPGKLMIGGSASIAGLNGATATIASPGLLTPGTIDLGGGTRTLTVADGAAETDLLVKVAVTNGGLVKAGAGTMRLAGAVSGSTGIAVSGGTLVGTSAALPNVTTDAQFVLDLAGNSTYVGAIGGGAGGSFIKRGVGQLDLTGTHTLAGGVTVSDSTMRLSGANGRLASVGGYNLLGGTLSVDNTGTNHNDRLSGGGIVLTGGTLNFVANTTTESAGDILAVGGASTVALSGTGTSSITFGSLIRSPGATINFSGVGGQVAAKLTTSFFPDAFVNQATFANGTDYAVVNADGLVRAMTAGAGDHDYATSLTPDRHVRLTASVQQSPSTSIKTLTLAHAGGTGVGLAIGATLTLENGGILVANGSGYSLDGTLSSKLIAPDDVEYVINTSQASSGLIINYPVTGGAGLTKTGPGTLILYAPNTYNGTTSVVAGTLDAGNNGEGLGQGNVYLSGGATLRALVPSSGRAVTLGPGGGTLESNGTWYGTISGPGGLTVKSGIALTLNGVANTYSGPTKIPSGTTLAAGATNLGDGGEANTLTISGGATLRTLGSINTARQIFFTPLGASVIDTNGYDSVFSSDIVTSGSVVKQGAGTLTFAGKGNDYGGTTSITGGTLVAAVLGTGPNGLNFQNGGRWRAGGDATFVRNIAFNAGGGVIDTDGYAVTLSGFLANSGSFTKSGHGQLTLTTNNGHTGTVAVVGGTLRLAGANGTLDDSTGYTIGGGGILQLDNSSTAGGNNNNRLSNTAPITMNGGTLWMYGNPTTESAGNLTLAGGYNSVIVNGSTTSTLALGTYTRQQGATVSFLNGSSTLKTTFTGGVTAGSFIDQGVFVGAGYAVYDAAGFVRVMASGAGDSDHTSTVTTNRHVRVTAATTSIPTSSIYTLAMVHGTAATTNTLAAGATLTLSKGGILSSGTGGVTISGGTAVTAPAGVEIVVHTPDSGDLLTISTPITGGSGLTKSGLGRLSLNSTGNSYTGPTFIAGGTLRLSTSNVIPDGSPLQIGVDAQLDLATRSETVASLTLLEDAQVVSFNSSNVASPGTLTMGAASPVISYNGGGRGAVIGGGTLALGASAGTANFVVNDGNDDVDLTVNANVVDGTGAHALTKNGNGTLALNGTANSFTGGVNVTVGRLDVNGALTSAAGTLDVGAGGTLGGSGSIAKPTTLTGGVIDFRSGATINSTLNTTGGTWKGLGTVTGVVTVTNNTLTIGAGANLTANAGVNVTSGTIAAMHANATITGSVNYTSATPGTWGGNIAGSGKTLTVNNAASLTLTGANTYTGGTNVNDGSLIVTGNNQLGTGGVTTGMVVVLPGSSGHGGSLRLSGNVSYGNALSIGGGGLTGSSTTAPGTIAALDNLSGVNSWSGVITLNGSGGNGGDPLLNQIGSTAGTLVLSGVIQGGTGQTWAKTGNGDVVLTGNSPNTHTNLTRLFGGRLIVEKNGALGAAGVNSGSTGNTFLLPGSASTLAFRAPASSPAGFNYSTFEVINTDGAVAPGFGQVDNLGGDNTFAGQIALGGNVGGGGLIDSPIGVTAGSLHVQGGLFARQSPSTGRRITKLGVGTLIVSGNSGLAQPNPNVTLLVNSTFQVGRGIVELRSPSATVTNLPGVRTWEIEDGATLRLASGLLETGTIGVADGGQVNVTPGAGKVVRTGALNMAPLARVDLAESDMIVDYNVGFSPLGTASGGVYDGVTGKVQSAHNGGAWDGYGVTTSMADAVAGLTSLGVGEAGDLLSIGPTDTATWNGQSVDGSSVLVMYTYAGDANLDGQITGDDYSGIDFSIQVPGSFGWANGDFNYDGQVTGDDYAAIDFNILAQGGPWEAVGR